MSLFLFLKFSVAGSISSWYSSLISSRVFLLVSGINKVVKIPNNMNKAKISMT